MRGLRVNTLKLAPEEFYRISPFPLGEKIEWCESAFNLLQTPPASKKSPSLPEPGKHPYHLAGLYYLQDPSAMAAAELLDPQPGERVLDLTAAPGGKTTHLASLMRGEGLLIANEIKTKRLNHLVVNVERWGSANLVVTNVTPEQLADHFGAFFDKVLVDAPCSGEGMFRKDMGARLDWSEQMVTGCAIRQTNILRVAAHLVRPGGCLLYSTCTFAPEEDEGVVARFLHEHHDFDVEALPQLPGFMPGRPDWLEIPANASSQEPATREILRGAVRLFPHRLKGEGHFACLLRRKPGPGDALTDLQSMVKIPAPLFKLWQAFQEEILNIEFPHSRLRLHGERLYFIPLELPDLRGLRITIPGILLGYFKKDRFEPAHTLAVFLRPGEAKHSLALGADSPQMAAYLHGESLPVEGHPGWTVVTVDGWPLGWGKRVQGVVKNHFPRGLQILS